MRRNKSSACPRARIGRLAVPYWKELGRLPTSLSNSSTVTHGIVYISLTPQPVFCMPKLSQHSTTPALPFPDCHLFASHVQQDTYLGTQETYMSFAHHHLIITILSSPPLRRNSTSPQYLASPSRPMCPKQSSTCATDGSARGYFSCFLFTSRRRNFPHLISLLD